jgi:hypothetical protein
MYIPDLTSLGDPKLLAVGWLTPKAHHCEGTVETEFLSALVRLLVNPWQPAIAAGKHHCEFCRFTGGPGSVTFDDCTVNIGSSNLWVPGSGCIYVSPSLVLHYIDAHGYCPPTEFREAVAACAPMRSIAYFKALISNGPPDIKRASLP